MARPKSIEFRARLVKMFPKALPRMCRFPGCALETQVLLPKASANGCKVQGSLLSFPTTVDIENVDREG